jgi:hypothetical protein
MAARRFQISDDIVVLRQRVDHGGRRFGNDLVVAGV